MRWPGLVAGGLPLVPFARFVSATAPRAARIVALFAFGDGGSHTSRQPGQLHWEVLAGLLDGLPPDLPGQLVQVGNTLCALLAPAAARPGPRPAGRA